jgi:hypothetical protein
VTEKKFQEIVEEGGVPEDDGRQKYTGKKKEL